MVDQKLINYIKSELSRGTSLQQIRKHLLSEGWSDRDINKAIDLVTSRKQTSRAETIAKIAKTGGTIFNIFYLAKMMFEVIIIIGIFSFLILSGLPWYVGIPFIIFGIIIIILQIMQIKRIMSEDVDDKSK